MNDYWLFIQKSNEIRGWVYGYFFDTSDLSSETINKIIPTDKSANNSFMDITMNDFAFVINNKKIYMKQPLESVNNILGKLIHEELVKRDENKEGKWDDIDMKYDGFRISGMRFWPEINYIFVETNEDVSTVRGIKIGSTREDIITKYGKEYSREDLMLYSLPLEDGYGFSYVLWFMPENNYVISFGFNVSD